MSSITVAGPERFSRRWLDLACLARHDAGRATLIDRELEEVRGRLHLFPAGLLALSRASGRDHSFKDPIAAGLEGMAPHAELNHAQWFVNEAACHCNSTPGRAASPDRPRQNRGVDMNIPDGKGRRSGGSPSS